MNQSPPDQSNRLREYFADVEAQSVGEHGFYSHHGGSLAGVEAGRHARPSTAPSRYTWRDWLVDNLVMVLIVSTLVVLAVAIALKVIGGKR